MSVYGPTGYPGDGGTNSPKCWSAPGSTGPAVGVLVIPPTALQRMLDITTATSAAARATPTRSPSLSASSGSSAAWNGTPDARAPSSNPTSATPSTGSTNRRERGLLGRRRRVRQRPRPRRPVRETPERQSQLRDQVRQPGPSRLRPPGRHPGVNVADASRGLAQARPAHLTGLRAHRDHRRHDRRRGRAAAGLRGRSRSPTTPSSMTGTWAGNRVVRSSSGVPTCSSPSAVRAGNSTPDTAMAGRAAGWSS